MSRYSEWASARSRIECAISGPDNPERSKEIVRRMSSKCSGVALTDIYEMVWPCYENGFGCVSTRPTAGRPNRNGSGLLISHAGMSFHVVLVMVAPGESVFSWQASSIVDAMMG